MKQLKPLIDTCPYCLTSRANQALRSLANVVSKSRGLPTSVSFLPLPPLSFFGSRFISRAIETENPLPRYFFCSETKRKRLLHRLIVVSFKLRIIDVYTEMSPGNFDILFDDATMTYHNLTSLLTFLI